MADEQTGRPSGMCFFQPDQEETRRGRNAAGGEAYRAQVERLGEWFDWADAVVVGAGSGLSSAAGYNHYHRGQAFDAAFGDFRRRYGFRSLMDGYYYLYGSLEAQWAYYARYIDFIRKAPAGQAYRDLLAVLGDRPYHVLTTNVDGQFAKAGFPEGHVTRFQGDMRLFQCSQPCHDGLYDNAEQVAAMIAATDGDLRIPAELVPRCPECGWQMLPWVRDDTFLEGALWREEVGRYQDFVDAHLRGGDRVLFLSLGVGDMTPRIITLPFWQMVRTHQNARLAMVNLAKESAPAQLGDRALAVQADLAAVLSDLR